MGEQGVNRMKIDQTFRCMSAIVDMLRSVHDGKYPHLLIHFQTFPYFPFFDIFAIDMSSMRL